MYGKTPSKPEKKFKDVMPKPPAKKFPFPPPKKSQK